MERRTFIIAAVAGGVGLAEYAWVSALMNALRNAGHFSAKPYETYGESAAQLGRRHGQQTIKVTAV